MLAPDAKSGGPDHTGAAALPLRLLLRFADASFERRFVRHYVTFYRLYAQASLLLGMLLVIGDWLVDRIAQGPSAANLLRLTVAVPVLAGGLGYSMLGSARRHWQPVMASFIATVALCLFEILIRIDAEGGAGLDTWVGILNFTFLQFYCFVILGVQWRYALAAGSAILALFLHALWTRGGLPLRQPAYWSYHVVTLFILASAIGWWREFVLRKEFAARAALDDSRVAAEQRALQLANYDEATGLPNRRLFSALTDPILERTRRSGAGCALLHVKIDRLGGINDAFGRGQVDLVLAEMAQRLRSCIRGGDVAAISQGGDAPALVARLADNAFSLLVTDLETQERASLVAHRLLAAVAQPVHVASQAMVLSASVGIAMFPGDAPDLAGLTRCAEQAARAAADAGGAQHKFFDEALNARVRERVALEGELREGIRCGQLRLHYQPKFDARDGRVVGAEALVRWEHPQRGLMPPASFIPLAEETGLVLPLTDWVLDAACASLRRWTDEGLPVLPLSINLPAASLAHGGLPRQLEDLLARHRLPASLVMLELTETMVMRDVESAVDVLGQLRERGFELSLDDFGTGYSSLSHLKRLPMNELKIDRAFVADVQRGGRDGALAAAIIALGSELGLKVVAEGVETAAQSEFLLARGCVLQQGFLFSRPLPRDAFEELLARA